MDTDVFNGFPTHIDRVGELLRISLQKDHKLGTFVENYLAENIKDLKSPRFVPKKDDLIPGMIGIGRYDDDQYYRIKVLDRPPQGNVVNVLFIDYGNHAVLPLSDIRLLRYELNKALLNIPPLAITCFLEKVSVNKPWNEEEFNTLKKLVLYEERQCIMRHLPNRVKVVNIYFHNANKRLTEIILENDMGTPVTDAELMANVKKLSSRAAFEDRQVQQPTNPLEQFTQRLSYSNENYIPERILTREVTYNFSSSHMLPVDSSYNAYISHMEDGPYSFSLQLKSSAEDALPRLSMLLKQEEPVLNTRPLLPGTMVMTSSRSDNSFRRSIVMNVKRNCCQVYHMDYGSNEEVPFSEVYQLPSQAQHAPAMALRFCLADIKSMQITDSAKAYFQELLLQKQVLIKVAPQESEGPLLQYCEMFYEGRNVKDIITAFSAPLEYTMQHPPRGKDIKVTVSHIHSPSLFFIQYNSKLDIINRIQESVEIHCKQQPRLRDLTGLNIGTPVAALYDDNIWYRGMIVGINQDSAQILYVDYGNRNDVPANNLCQMSRDLVTKWRAQAVECCLQGFENDNTNDVEQEVLDMMEETLNQHFNMTPILILPGNRYVVELIDELGGKLSEKIKQVKSRSSLHSEGPPSKPTQDSSVADVDVYPVDGNQKSSKSKGKNENLFVRPSVRPVLETQSKPYTHEHDDRCDDFKSKGFNRQASFEKPPRFSKGDEQPRRGRDMFEEQKSSNKFSDTSNDWEESGAVDRRNLGSNRDSFSRTPSHDSFKPFSRSTPNEEDDKGFSEHPRRGPRDRMSGADIQKKPFGRPNRNNNWVESSPDVGDASHNVKGVKNDPQSKWNTEGDNSRNEDRTRQSNKGNDRPRFNRTYEDHGAQRNDKNDNNSNVWNDNNEDRPKWNDKNKWGGERDNERPKREGGNRFNERKPDDGDFGGNRFGGKRNRDELEADSNTGKFGDRRRDDGEAAGGRFGERRRDEGFSGGNRFGDRRRGEDGEGGGNRFGERRRGEDGEGGGNRFGDRRRDAGEGNRFSGRRRDDGETAGNRFNDRRKDDAQERRGGRFREGEGPGRREGGRFNKDNEFRKKRFDSDFADSSKATDANLQQGNASEDWGVVELPVKVPKPQVGGSYPMQKITANTELQVVVSSVVNPHFFYVQEAGCGPDLDMMRTTIDNLGQGLRPLKENSLAPGVPVLAKFSEDQALYRGSVKHLIPPSKARILFIDYGNFEDVHINDLFYMPPELLDKPPLALHCTLPDINPISEKWPENSNIFDAYLNAEEILTMNVSLVKMVDGEMVIIAKLTNSSGIPLSKMLIDASLALPVPGSGVAEYAHKSMGAGDNSFKPDINSEESATEDLGHENVESQPADKWIDRLTLLVGQKLYGETLEAANGKAFAIRLFDAKVVTLATLADHQSSLCVVPSSKVIIGVEEVLDDRLKVTLYGLDGIEKSPFIDEKTKPRMISPICSFPVVHSVEQVCISHVEGTTIYIQRLADIDKLGQLLEETYNLYNDTNVEEVEWSVGDLCCAKSLLDENWYRAEITSSGDEYTLKYLDYGNSEVLPKENLRKLVKKFYFPLFALDVSLAVEWKALDPPLMDLVAGEEFVCKFINDDRKWLVDLTFSSGKRLNDLLVEKEIALEKPNDPFKEINSAIGSDLTAGSKIPILVSHADSPTMFWAHMQSHINKVDELQEKLQGVIADAPDASELDEVFAAQYSADSVWYRATRVNKETLRFIDYGNTDALLSPKKLPDEMVKPVSGYAIAMYLCVKPVTGDWTDEAIKEFEIFIEEQNIVAEIINVDYKVIVDLREGEKLLSKILIDSGHAVYCDFVPKEVKKFSQLKVPDSFTQRIFDDSSRGNINPTISKIENSSKSNVDKTTKVYVTHSNSLNDFYIQEDSKTDLIDSLQNRLFEIEEAEKALDVKIGQLYGAKYEDELWYRVRVLSTEPEIKVQLADYGNIFTTSDLRLLPENLISEQILAVHCSLGVEGSPEANSKFVSLSNGQIPFNMTVLSPGSPMTVQLSDDEGNNILNLFGISPAAVNIVQENTRAPRQKIFITHMYSPECFFTQTEEQLSKLEELSVQMSSAENFKRLERMLVGDMIAVLFEDDDCWYRGEVLTFAPDVIVRFIDYGSTAFVTEYRELPSELKSIECLTMKCSLKLPEGVEYWPEASAELFLTMCAMNPEKLQMEIISHSSDIIIVELYINNEPITKSLVEVSSTPFTTYDDETGNFVESSEATNVESKKPGRGYITHINSVSDFYVQKEDCADLLRKIQDGLSSLKDNANSKPDCGIGSLIATKFLDGEWYRGEILQIGSEIRVRFVDYGNECNVSEIATLPKEFLEIPPVAMKCSLDIEGKKLKENAKEILKKLCGDTETLFNFTIKTQKDGVNIVEIILNDKNVLSNLCTENSSSGNQDEKTNIAEKTSISEESTSELVGKQIKGFISHVNSVREFFIHEESTTESLQSVQAGLNESYSVENAPAVCEVGDLIAAKFTDGSWYRAEVIETLPEVKVRFIDYGNESVVSEMSTLTSELLEMPAAALRCSLEVGNLNVNDDINDAFVKISEDPDILYDFHIVSNNNGLSIVKVVLDGEDIFLKLKDMSLDHSEKVENKSISKLVTLSGKPETEFGGIAKDEQTLSVDESKNDVQNRVESSGSDDGLPVSSTLECPSMEKTSESFSEDLKTKDENLNNAQEIENNSLSKLDTPDSKPKSNFKDDEQSVSLEEPKNDSANSIESSGLDDHPVKLSATLEIPMTQSNDSVEKSKDMENFSPKLESVTGSEQSSTDISLGSNKLIPVINSITDFYIINPNVDINVIENTLKKADLFEDPVGVNLDDILAGKTSEDTWYRCKIIDILPDSFKVCLIDHGRQTFVNKLKELPTNLILFESKTLQCSLYCPEGITHWPEDLLSRFVSICDDVCGYDIVDDSVSPIVVKLNSSQGDVSNLLLTYCVGNCSESVSNTENGDIKVSNVKNDLLLQTAGAVTKEVSNQIDGAKIIEEKKQHRKSLPSKPVKSLAEIKANAKPRIVTRSQGASPVDRKLTRSQDVSSVDGKQMKSESRSEPELQQIQTPEHLQRPLFIRTSSLDDKPVPGCFSNPSSPVFQGSPHSKEEEAPQSPVVHSSPRHSVAERIVPGSVLGVVTDTSVEDKD